MPPVALKKKFETTCPVVASQKSIVTVLSDCSRPSRNDPNSWPAAVMSALLDFEAFAARFRSVLYVEADSSSANFTVSALKPKGSENVTGSPFANPYRFKPPAKPMGSSCVRLLIDAQS